MTPVSDGHFCHLHSGVTVGYKTMSDNNADASKVKREKSISNRTTIDWLAQFVCAVLSRFAAVGHRVEAGSPNEKSQFKSARVKQRQHFALEDLRLG
jgi:hypothetical protein